ncbi:ribonuclease H-like domain-containing protein [Haloarcula laminariae]|uniref:ribonuclease H-like domain-containing protein n=1 Tax=Haloarcula laminariae TaxID=2961577 RepID=UPI002406FD0F|nr:ribonuclease H-like domain-containing protein [Halomicroarcula sp. FL173]
MTDLKTVAFDIETTGFATTDQLTVIGFDAAISSRVFLNTGEQTSPSQLEQRLNEELETPITLSVHDSEAALLEAMTAFVDATIADQECKLVAYNGDTWNGGFDLPFLRTRLTAHDLGWPFAELPYVEVLDVFESRFNTTEDTLDGVYEELIGTGLSDVDPFTDSAAAVTAWENGNFEQLVLHNIADIRRTRALMELAERYCSKSDFSMKSLDPVVN